MAGNNTTYAPDNTLFPILNGLGGLAAFPGQIKSMPGPSVLAEMDTQIRIENGRKVLIFWSNRKRSLFGIQLNSEDFLADFDHGHLVVPEDA
jgi:hypothetical protein